MSSRRWSSRDVVASLLATACMFSSGRACADDAACSAAALEDATTPALAHQLELQCVDVPSIRFAALDKLNAMPLPAAVPVFVPAQLGGGPTEKITFSMDVFFDVDEAYPTPVAFEKMADLVRRMSGRGSLYVIIISSSENAFEHGASVDVAELRTALVRRYLVAAGIEPARIYGKVQAPDHDDSPEGRARDRCARVEVVMYRDKVAR